MKILLTGKNSKNIEGLVKSLGFEIVNLNPDAIISYGGDGTLLSSERTYPGIPKLPIRNSLICKKCSSHEENVLLRKLQGLKLQIKEYQKLETTILYQTFYSLNDFVIRNSVPIHAIRFRVTHTMLSASGGPINNKLLIGDGVVLSTPFGSTGYFKSITGKTFQDGFGLAFNNTTEKLPPVFFKDKKEIVTFKLVRGTATLSFDNSPDILTIDEGSEVKFKLSDKTAKIYEAQSLRCPRCKITRG